MRKNAKERKMAKNMYASTDDEGLSFIKILAILVAIVLIFWLITYLVTNKKSTTNTSSDVTIQYTKILVGSILNRNEESYYVLVEGADDSNTSNYETLITTYNSKDDHLRVYTVDLSDGFNQTYVATTANLNVDKITDIRFNGTTLLKIESGKITDTVTDADAINTYLTNLSA